MEDNTRLKTQMIVTLLFLFLVFVVIDVASTQWLILNSPGGLVNEVNPIGILLYSNFGAAGIIFPKFGLFTIFAAMAILFSTRYAHLKWFIEATQALVLIQFALSLIVSFNNFIAILAVLYVIGQWPIANITKEMAVMGIYAADLGLGAIFANGIMYIWGLTRKTLHVKVFLGLFIFITPLLLFSDGFRSYLWLFAIYVASASTALGIGFYISEGTKMSRDDTPSLRRDSDTESKKRR
ncbi:MAG: hypothetical protein HY619_04570 [Thaumarchaeota archaeon]|nr:hypothetical protein [Nitrososphaerota archaeon]